MISWFVKWFKYGYIPLPTFWSSHLLNFSFPIPTSAFRIRPSHFQSPGSINALSITSQEQSLRNEIIPVDRRITIVMLTMDENWNSIPDEIYHSADQLARRLGISRSELYAKAVSDYFNAHNNEAVTKALNRIYAKEMSEIDPVIDLIQLGSLPKESWWSSTEKFGARNFMRRIHYGLRLVLSL